MQKTPKGLRLHIGLFGRRNVGKSSLLNAFTRQSVSIVSDVAGTTTDPVEKPMELLPIGPVLFIDTAGLDDEGVLGRLRTERTRRIFDRTDVGVLVVAAGAWSEFEDSVVTELASRQTPLIVVFNKTDLQAPEADMLARLRAQSVPTVLTDARTGQGVGELRHALIRTVPDEFIKAPVIIGDLVPPGETAVLVTPIDKEAPKGRLILPQVQAIRDLLDHGAYCIVTREHELANALANLKKPPALVVTDSQAFEHVAEITPPNVPLTSFSILFARFKGDLIALARGALAVDELRSGARILIAEACAHHPIEDDIGREKIPRWLREYVGEPLEFTHVQGHDFPTNLSDYRLVIHCGACVHNRREVLTRIETCRQAGVPMTNYGMVIAHTFGILERALRPFPQTAFLFENSTGPRERARNCNS